jgi:MFS family permease
MSLSEAEPPATISATAEPRPPLIFLFMTVFVDMIGYGIVIPLLPLFLQQQVEGATLVGAFGALYAATQGVCGPLLSGLSDRFGRRPLLLFCLAGTGLAYLLLGLANTLWLVVLALLLDAATGGNQSIAQAYLADSLPPAERTRGFGVLSAAFGLGIMVGPVIGGLLSDYGLGVPALVAAGLTGANLLVGLVTLPESLPPERRRTSQSQRINPLDQLLQTMSESRELLGAIFLINLAFVGLQSNFPLFSSAVFAWDARSNAFLFAFVGMCAVLTQALILGRLRQRFSDMVLVRLGLGLTALGLGLFGLVREGWMLFPLAALAALGTNVAIPALSGLLSVRVAHNEQGRLMGALQTTLNIALVAGPLLAGVLFDTVHPVAPYVSGGGFALLALLALRRSKAID